MSDGLTAGLNLIRERGFDDSVAKSFAHYYGQLERGVTRYIREHDVLPLTSAQSFAELSYGEDEVDAALQRVGILKLNGGLGTSMGMTGPKSALPVKEGLTFLDIIARQVLRIRERTGVLVPLTLMNSFRTQEESRRILAAYPELADQSLPQDFLQSAIPKLLTHELVPVQWPADPELEWCPPGHGDVYRALYATGMLQTYLEQGIDYLFLSNADNLGAECSGQIAAWLMDTQTPYLSEVCVRTPADRKGGQLVIRSGRMVLRDNAMVHPEDMDEYQDIELHPLFHCNNLWIKLEVLIRLLDECDGFLPLPLMVNEKNVDPTDPSSPRVVQLETAMGQAIELFEGAQAMIVPRTRFRPVKTTNDLLVLRSDRFELDDDSSVIELGTGPTPVVTLSEQYATIAGFDSRFEAIPSLRDCSTLNVAGDVTFGPDVTCLGAVVIHASDPARVANRVLTGAVNL